MSKTEVGAGNNNTNSKLRSAVGSCNGYPGQVTRGRCAHSFIVCACIRLLNMQARHQTKLCPCRDEEGLWSVSVKPSGSVDFLQSACRVVSFLQGMPCTVVLSL